MMMLPFPSLSTRLWLLYFILHLVAMSQTLAFVSRQDGCQHHGVTSFHGRRREPLQILREAARPQLLGAPICEYHEVKIPTSQPGPPRQALCVEDLTPTLTQLLQQSGMRNGVVTVISRHTTTAITINERESRLAKDMEQYFLQLVPPDERSAAAAAVASVRYFHNDIHLRPDGVEEAQRCRENGWDIDQPLVLQQWRDQEPINAHSHLLVMLLGSSESIPVHEERMVIGQWQSVLLVDCDAPRDRTVGIQFMGYM